MRLKNKPNLLILGEYASSCNLEETLSYLKTGKNFTNLSYLGEGALDCCGTGGSGIKKFNYSTSIAFILNAAGLKIVKFGNRSQTGNSGSQDFLDCLGIPDTANEPAIYEKIIESQNLLFLNAQKFYPELKELSGQRKELGKPTVLNYIGPLLNPLTPEFQMIGVSNLERMKDLALICQKQSNLSRAILYHSKPNLDELSILGTNISIEVENSSKSVTESQIKYLAMSEPLIEDSKIEYSKEKNAEIFRRIIEGIDNNSLVYKNLLVNAALGLQFRQVCNSIDEGVLLAAELIKEGYVKASYESLRRLHCEYAN